MSGAAHPGFLAEFAATRAYLLGRPGRLQITADATAVVFLRSGPRTPDQGLFELEIATGRLREVTTPAAILGGASESISAAEQARRERQRITDRGFTWFTLSPDGRTILVTLSGGLFSVDRATGAARALVAPSDDPVLDPRFSPDGRSIAFVRAAELHVLDASGSVRALTTGGSEDLLHGLAEFVAQEEMARHEGYWWSPDSSRLAYAEVDQSPVERFAIADPARPERAPLTFRYPRPGKRNAEVRLGIASVANAATTWVTWDRARYPYLARVLWDSPRAPLAVLVQTRDQREAALLAVDEATGDTWPLVLERDEAWVNLDRDLPRWLPDGSGLLWATEREGGRALELRTPEGRLTRTLLGPGDGFLSLAHVTADGQTAHVLLGDALTNRIVRLDVASGTRHEVALERTDLEHAPIFSRDAALFVDTRVAADALPETRVYRSDGTALALVPSAAATPPLRAVPDLVTVDGQGGRRFHAALLRPRDFQTGRRYPVIVHVYGGPHALTVKADERQYLLDQWIADHGAVVVCIDNRGTPRRGREWERAVKGRFGDVPLDDQVEALQALGARFPELDLGRVGIYGWSFGGYMAALAVLRRPDVFKVAVAGAPVVDWLDYDTHYTERYLDLPEKAPEAYRSGSLLTHAASLSRPLLLIHGTADDNVYFFHSLKLADALFRAGRRFDFLPLPGVTHQIAEAPLRARLWERVKDYLFAHL